MISDLCNKYYNITCLPKGSTNSADCYETWYEYESIESKSNSESDKTNSDSE